MPPQTLKRMRILTELVRQTKNLIRGIILLDHISMELREAVYMNQWARARNLSRRHERVKKILWPTR